MTPATRHFLQFSDFSRDEIDHLFQSLSATTKVKP